MSGVFAKLSASLETPLSVIGCVLRRCGKSKLWYLRHLRVRGRHLFRFLSCSSDRRRVSIIRGVCGLNSTWETPLSSYLFYRIRISGKFCPGYLRDSAVLWRHLFLLHRVFFIFAVLFLLCKQRRRPSDRWVASRGSFCSVSRSGKGHLCGRAAIHVRENLFGGHLSFFSLRTPAIPVKRSLLKKRMHRQGRTCGSCACRNSSDQIIRGRVWLTHKPCFKEIGFSKLAHILALL